MIPVTALSRRIGASIASVWLVLVLTFAPIAQVQAFVWSPGFGIKFPPPPGAAAAIIRAAPAGPFSLPASIGIVILALCLEGTQWVCFKPRNAPDDQPSTQQTQAPTFPPNSTNYYWSWVNLPAGHALKQEPVPTASGAAAANAYNWTSASNMTNCHRNSTNGTVEVWRCTYGSNTYDASVQKVVACSAGQYYVNGSCTSTPTYCPAGYSYTNGLCVGPASYTADGSPTVRVDSAGTGWETHPSDPDTPAQPVSGEQTSSGTDAAGRPTMTKVTPLADGGVKVQHIVQNVLSSGDSINSGNTTTTTNTIVINSAGGVASSTTITNYGAIDSQGGPAPDIPTDYNREVTQQAIQTDVATMKEKQQELLDEVKGVEAPDVPPPQDFQDVRDKQQQLEDTIAGIPDQYQASKSTWFSWVWTPPVGTCEAVTGSIHGVSVSWNYCFYVNMIRDTIGWLFAVFGAWSIYLELFRRGDD